MASTTSCCPTRVFGAINRVGDRLPALIPRLNRLAARALSARDYIDVSYRVFTSPRRVRFREMEYAVPRDAGLQVLREIRDAGSSSRG